MGGSSQHRHVEEPCSARNMKVLTMVTVFRKFILEGVSPRGLGCMLVLLSIYEMASIVVCNDVGAGSLAQSNARLRQCLLSSCGGLPRARASPSAVNDG